jgi:anti-sigma B factor antagonist
MEHHVAMIGLQVERLDRVPVAHVSMDLDAASAAKLRERLIASLPRDASSLVLDLSDTRYVDSAGIDMLLRLGRSLEHRRVSLRLALPPGSGVARLVELVGLANAVPVHESVEEAVRAASANRAPDRDGA